MLNLIAHRGNNNNLYPENSSLGIISSLKENYIKGVEFDVRLTKDKKLVIIHDFTINRTSNGHGIVKNMTLKQLREYDFGNENYSFKIMTLEQLLKQIRSNKIIVIEIKHEGLNYKEMANRVMKVIKSYKKLNIYITGFSYKLTNYLKNKYPNYKIGAAPLIVNNKTSFTDGYSAYFIRHNFFKNYKTNKLLFFWTINKPSFFKDKTITDNMYFITDRAEVLKDI